MQNIPENLDRALSSPDTLAVLKELWYQFRLSNQQQIALGNETGNYMLGKTKADHFIGNLMHRMDVNKSVAEEIKKIIDTKIIAPVQDSFDKLQNEDSFEESGIEVEDLPAEKEVSIDEEYTEKAATKASVLNDIEDPLHTETNQGDEDGEYSNHAPLNILQDDVLQGIEDPETQDESKKSGEGTDLDMQLDQILKKPRGNGSLPPVYPKNLPTEPTVEQPKFAETHKAQQAETNAAPTTKPSPVKQTPPKTYEKGADPYREPLE